MLELCQNGSRKTRGTTLAMKHLGDFELKTVVLHSFVPRYKKPRCASVFSTQIALHVGFPGDQMAVPCRPSDGIFGAPLGRRVADAELRRQALAAAIIGNRSLWELQLDRSLRDTPGGEASGSGAV